MNRRALLGVTGAGTAAAVTALAHGDGASASATTGADRSYPFEGDHQQGILTPVQQVAVVVACDVTAGTAAQLRHLLQTLTDRIRDLTSATRADHGVVASDADSGILGPDLIAGGLTVTLSVSASLFDHRFGLAGRAPARLHEMTAFPNDDLDPALCGGDVLLQICADTTDVALHALRDLMRATRGFLQPRWRRDGFSSPPRPSGTPRNLLGFKDGTANPDVTDAATMDRLVWTHAGADEPDWVEGGSYHVVRVIRMFVEFWDRVSVREQNAIFGRDKASGAPLSGTDEFDAPDYTGQTGGGAIRFDAHIRLASNSGQADDQRLLRRSFNYDAGLDAVGDLEMGHVFICFNQDLRRQFLTVQNRLVDEPLADYVSPIGGGYFFALPGVRGSGDWLGRGMFA